MNVTLSYFWRFVIGENPSFFPKDSQQARLTGGSSKPPFPDPTGSVPAGIHIQLVQNAAKMTLNSLITDA
jgi:hypothetical protein